MTPPASAPSATSKVREVQRARSCAVEATGARGTAAPADIVIYDPTGRTEIGIDKKHHMNMDHAAWEGFDIDGHVDTVLSRGKVVIDNDQYLGSTSPFSHWPADGLADTCIDSGSHVKPDDSTDRLPHDVADGLDGSGSDGIDQSGCSISHSHGGCSPCWLQSECRTRNVNWLRCAL